MKKGFTLIELLVAISVMGILGLIFTEALIQTLRGQNKVRVLNQVKQNGQVALDRISSEVRRAEKVVCIGTDIPGGKNNTMVLYRQGTYSRFRMFSPNPGNENGYIARYDFTTGQLTTITTDRELCGTNAGSSTKLFLTDIDPVTGVSLDYADNSTPVFYLSESAGYNDVVVISFRAYQGEKTGKTYEAMGRSEGIIFSTTAQVRGIK